MNKGIDPNLPRYKSDRYHEEFKLDRSKNEDRFKRAGEFNSETIVEIEQYRGSVSLNWKRKTLSGTENIYLGKIWPTDGFLEFLDDFIPKKGWLSKRQEITYGLLMAVCRACETDSTKFKALVRKAENVQELMVLLGIE